MLLLQSLVHDVQEWQKEYLFVSSKNSHHAPRFLRTNLDQALEKRSMNPRFSDSDSVLVKN